MYLSELGLYHYRARVYNPQIGRFMQTDPVGYADQINMYAYVGNDPLSAIDPSGMYECTTDGDKKTCEGTQDEVDQMRKEMEGYKITGATSGFGGDITGYDSWHYSTEINSSDYLLIGVSFAPIVGLLGPETAALGAEGPANRTLVDILGKEGKQLVESINRGRADRNLLSSSQREAAARFFREAAERVGGRYKDAAAKFNRLRADFLEGKTNEVPGGLKEFMKRHGLL